MRRRVWRRRRRVLGYRREQGACSYAIASALPQCQIVLVEPQTSLTDLLKHNMALLAPDRHEIFPVGLGTEPGEFKLAIPESNKGGASLVFDAQHSKLPTVTVRVETAQKVSESSRFGWPTLIKMDVEGFEPIVFQSLESRDQRFADRRGEY